jgi:SMODS-associated and fused to various effectors sensor domain
MAGRTRTNALSSLSRIVIWARAAGRCQYEGCNCVLIGDLISGAEDKNFGFVAHIVADTPTGPRGDVKLSRLLSNDVNNLMLLCHRHHKLIDVDDVAGHPVFRLQAMKAAHERRIETVSDIVAERASHVLRYAANIGGHQSPLSYDQVALALLPEKYPAEGRRTIDIEMRGSTLRDHEQRFWEVERDNLGRQFEKKVFERIESREIRHMSVFALAPQPLLVELGRLLCDIADVTVHQLHREPKGWDWRPNDKAITFRNRESSGTGQDVALVLALSATVVDDRVMTILGENAPIWTIEADAPNNDIMRRPADLMEFRRLLRRTFDRIKAQHGEAATIHVFPALPVSAAVEVGRVWMPKADLPMIIYDQNWRSNGFSPAIRVGRPPLAAHRAA